MNFIIYVVYHPDTKILDVHNHPIVFLGNSEHLGNCEQAILGTYLYPNSTNN